MDEFSELKKTAELLSLQIKEVNKLGAQIVRLLKAASGEPERSPEISGGLARYVQQMKEAKQQELDAYLQTEPGSGLARYIAEQEKLAAWYNPLSWPAAWQAAQLDKKIDDYNAALWQKHPNGRYEDGTPILVNRGSTFARNGQRFTIDSNVPSRLRTNVIDLYDAMHKRDVQNRHGVLLPPLPSVGMTADNQEYLGKYNANEAMWGPLLPFSRGLRLTPSADSDTVLHEGGHQRDYRTKNLLAWLRDVYFGGLIPSMTDRLENKADSIGRELDQLVHPDSKAKTWLHGQR